jgi:serine/threonine protein kinase
MRRGKTVQARSKSQQDEFRAIVRLFVQEARRLAKLDHPNIVGVHQVFEDNETAYMALDFVDGQDMHEVVENDPGRLTPEKIITILKKLLEAVTFVHELHILHRDISPDNILLDAADEPVLIDFGAAREKATRASRTLSSLLVVKDGYSPQEFYIEGSQQGPASDLYALGATFYHVLTGGPPPNSHARLACRGGERARPLRPLAGRSDLFAPEFLSAIDRALSDLPKDRPPDRLRMALRDRRRYAARARRPDRRPSNDRNMEESIAQLVEETNRAVLEARRLEEERARQAAKMAPARRRRRKSPSSPGRSRTASSPKTTCA